MMIRVVVADDHALLRNGLCSLLAESPGIEVVGQASDGLEAVRLAGELKPDLVVMDIAMRRLGGVEATRRITRDHPDVRVLVVSQYDSRERVLDAIEAGASGYLPKQAAGAELTAAIKAVATGQAYLHPAAAKTLIDAFLDCGGTRCVDRYSLLTDREREVFVLVAEGHTNQQIAEMLHVSPRTVDGHRTSLMAKLGLHDRTEVLRYALRRQLVEL